MPFCTDTDLLYWEPDLFNAAAGAAQTLVSGVANVTGTTASFAGVSLGDARVRPLDVASFSGTTVKGSFPIVSVDSDTDVTLSVLYDELFGADGTRTDAPASHVGAGSTVPAAVRTFYPQRRVVTQVLLQAAGVEPGEVGAEEKVVNPEVLRRACVLGTLQMIYSALAAAATDPSKLSVRADLYERLYRRAMREARVEVDLDGDGKPEACRVLGMVRWVRG